MPAAPTTQGAPARRFDQLPAGAKPGTLAQRNGRAAVALDLTGILAFVAVQGYLVATTREGMAAHLWVLPIAVFLGVFGSDFLSGVVHWGGDTWGSPATPWFGEKFIQPFREHHVDQIALTRHGFLELNGNNCLIQLLVLVPATWLPRGTGDPAGVFFASTAILLCMFLAATNKFHQWAHMLAPPRAAAWLQRRGLILRSEVHAIHHVSPYDEYYCITTGWMNAPLSRVGFWRRAERAISAITGAVPRASDIRIAEAFAAGPPAG